MKPCENPPAIVRAAADLRLLAQRVRGREKQNRTAQLAHVRQQAADVLAARQQCKRGQWGPWCEQAGLSQPMAWRYAEFGKVFVTNDFSSLPEDEQWAVWQRISGNAPPQESEPEEEAPLSQGQGGVSGASSGPPAATPSAPPDAESTGDTPASEEENAPSDSTPHVARNTGNPEWYTPPEYMEAARRVLKRIDLDPASSEVAQRTVKADAYYTADDDGLTKEWAGRVWLNPPYAAELIGRFTAKLCEHYQSGDVKAAILLVNNATETQWFQAAVKECAVICFPSGRIRFLDQNGDPCGAPLQGQAVLYYGEDAERFAREFGGFGFCVRAAQ